MRKTSEPPLTLRGMNDDASGFSTPLPTRDPMPPPEIGDQNAAYCSWRIRHLQRTTLTKYAEEANQRGIWKSQGKTDNNSTASPMTRPQTPVPCKPQESVPPADPLDGWKLPFWLEAGSPSAAGMPIGAEAACCVRGGSAGCAGCAGGAGWGTAAACTHRPRGTISSGAGGTALR